MFGSVWVHLSVAMLQICGPTFRSESPYLCLGCVRKVRSAADGETIKQCFKSDLWPVRGTCLSPQCGHDGGGREIQLVEEEDIGVLNLNAVRLQDVWRIVLDVLGDNDIGAAHDGGRHDYDSRPHQEG